MRKTRRSLLLVLALLLALSACDVFDTRDSEDPAETAEWNPFPVSPALAADNLRFAWMYAQNSTRYAELLADGFEFRCDQQDVVEYGVLSEWDAETEQLVLAQMYTQSPGDGNVVELTTVDGEEDVIEANEASLVRDYRVEVYYSGSASPEVYEGRLALDLVRGQDGLWRVFVWSDSRKNNNATSWGRMKDAFRT